MGPSIINPRPFLDLVDILNPNVNVDLIDKVGLKDEISLVINLIPKLVPFQASDLPHPKGGFLSSPWPSFNQTQPNR